MSKKIPAPPALTFSLSSDIAKIPEKLAQEVSEQSILMASLSNLHLTQLSQKVDSIKGQDKIGPPVYHVSLPEDTYNVHRRNSDGISGASELLNKINGNLLTPRGTMAASRGGEPTVKTPVDFFNHLHTHTLSSMTHKAELYLVLRNGATGLVEKEIPFKLGTSERGKAIEEMLSSRYETGFGVAIDNISITADGQDPALSKFVTCDLSIKVASGRYLEKFVNNVYPHPGTNKKTPLVIEDLFFTEKHSNYDYEKKTGYKAEIKLLLDYTTPDLSGYKSDKKKLIKGNLKYLSNTFYLKPSIYDISVEPSGSLTFSVKYHSTMDADMDRKTVKPKLEKSEKKDLESKSLYKLFQALRQYERENPRADTTAVEDFLAFSKAHRATAAENSKIRRCSEMIDAITRDGDRVLVLPYHLKNHPEPPPDRFPQQVAPGASTKVKEVGTNQLEYTFDSPMLRTVYSASSSDTIGILQDSRPIRAIEFVLFGDVIDTVFKKILTLDEDSCEAAIFSAFSFNMYDFGEMAVVDKIIAMKNVPVSMDLLWDLLYESNVTDTGKVDVSNMKYYSDLISKAYSTIYKTCDHAIGFLRSKSSQATTNPSIRKLGASEINAYEVYAPKSVFKKVLNPKRMPTVPKSRELSQRDLQDISKEISFSDSHKGRILIFTSHIPYVGASEESRPSDFLFSSFGQYGIVKNFSYSSVDIDGLLESHIISRAADAPGQTDSDIIKNMYNIMLKVDLTTFGYPAVIPGTIVEIDKVLLTAEPNSKLHNSLRKRFFITRVSTTMNKSEYTTKIEGYPLNDGKIPPPPNDLLKHSYTSDDQKHLNSLIRAFSSYQSRTTAGHSDFNESIKSHLRLFYDSDFFPKRITEAYGINARIPIRMTNKRGYRASTAPYAHPGSWGDLKYTPSETFGGTGTLELTPSYKEKKYETISDPITDAITDAEKIKELVKEDLQTLLEPFGTNIDPVPAHASDFGAYLKTLFVALDNFAYKGTSLEFSPKQILSGLKIIQHSISQWRSRISILGQTAPDTKTKKMFSEVLKDESGLLSDNNAADLQRLITEYKAFTSSLDTSNQKIDLLSETLKAIKGEN